MAPLVNHLTFKPQPVISFSEEQQTLPLLRVLSDGAITRSNLHVANLAFAKILERAVGSVTIGIAVLQSFIASDDNHHRVLDRRDDPALLLTAEARVNVCAPVINAPNLKTPTHQISQEERGRYG